MKKQTRCKEQALERKRAAYMIAWRDQVIAAQKEILEGRAEEARLYAAILQYCLTAMVGVVPAKDGADESLPALRIPKGGIRQMLDEWSIRCDSDEGDYILYFSKRGTEAQNAFEKEE